jgi:hypothetical protein
VHVKNVSQYTLQDLSKYLGKNFHRIIFFSFHHHSHSDSASAQEFFLISFHFSLFLLVHIKFLHFIIIASFILERGECKFEGSFFFFTHFLVFDWKGDEFGFYYFIHSSGKVICLSWWKINELNIFFCIPVHRVMKHDDDVFIVVQTWND